MALDHDLCQEAVKINGWKLSFAGDYLSLGPLVDATIWTSHRKLFRARIGLMEYGEHQRYGLVPDDEAKTENGIRYQEVALVHPSRQQDYQAELLDAIILHLKQLPAGTSPEIILPAELRSQVQRTHFNLLTTWGQYEQTNHCAPLSIFKHGWDPDEHSNIYRRGIVPDSD